MTTEQPREQLRDTRTGRYVHEWGFIGGDDSGDSWSETEECSHCGKVRVRGPEGRIKTYKNREAARRAGAPMLEGY